MVDEVGVAVVVEVDRRDAIETADRRRQFETFRLFKFAAPRKRPVTEQIDALPGDDEDIGRLVAVPITGMNTEARSALVDHDGRRKRVPALTVATEISKKAHAAIGIANHKVHATVPIEIGGCGFRPRSLQVGEIESRLLASWRLPHLDQSSVGKRQSIADFVQVGLTVVSSIFMEPDMAAMRAANQIQVSVAVQIRHLGRRGPAGVDRLAIDLQGTSRAKIRRSIGQLADILEVEDPTSNKAARQEIDITVAIPVDRPRARVVTDIDRLPRSFMENSSAIECGLFVAAGVLGKDDISGRKAMQQIGQTVADPPGRRRARTLSNNLQRMQIDALVRRRPGNKLVKVKRHPSNQFVLRAAQVRQGRNFNHHTMTGLSFPRRALGGESFVIG